jgi:hypothetical protein
MGQKFAPEIWVETLIFCPPEIPSLNPTILGAGNSAPRAGISAPAVSPYKMGGPGWRYLLASLSTPDPLSRNRRRRLTKDVSGDSLAVRIPRFHRSSLLLAWGSFPPRGFRHGRQYCPKSLSLGAYALVLDSFGLIRFSLKGACFRGSFPSREPRMELSWCRSIFLEMFVSIS